MSDPKAFLQQLIVQGIQVWPEADKLRCGGPQHRITPALLQQLKEHKAALLQALSTAEYIALSYGQKGLWSIHQIAPENSAYNVSLAYRIQGHLDVRLLNNVIQLLVNRHAALRTRFVWQEGALMQMVAGYQAAVFEELAALEEADDCHQAQAQRLHARPFDLTHGPLFRTALLSHGAEQYTLLLSAHHIIVDGWSMYQLVDELFALYFALVQGAVAELPLVQYTYADYVDWQQRRLQADEAQLWHYWQQELTGELPLLQLPTDYPRPPQQRFRGISQAIQLSAQLTERLKQVARLTGCTLYTVLLTAYALFLQRHSGQAELLVGLPMAGRARPEFMDIIGYFVSPVVLRTTFPDNQSLQALFVQVKARVLAAQDQQDYPVARLVERLNPPRDASYSPLFQSTFVLQRDHRSQLSNRPGVAYARTGLQVELLPLPLFAGQDDLALEWVESPDGLRGFLKGNADLFTPATLARMADRLAVLLEAIATLELPALAQPIAHLPLLTAAERQQLLVTWNETATAYPHDQCIHHRFEAQVARTPDAVAVVCDGQQLTYAELNVRANQLAHYLQSQGVGQKPASPVLVALCVERSLEMVIGLFGILKAGGAYVPLDPTYPPERLALMLTTAASPLLLTQAHLQAKLPTTQAQLLCLDQDWPLIATSADHNPTGAVAIDQLAYVIFTSGSTGQPKGAGVYHHSFTNLVHWYTTHFGLTTHDRTLIVSSFSFDLTQKNFFAPLIVGGQLHLSPAALFDYPTMRALIAHAQITWLNCAPSAFYPFLEDEAVAPPADPYRQLAALRYLFLGGEPINHARLAPWLHSPTCQATLVNTYGPTECTDVVAAYQLTNALPSIPIGKPIFNAALYLLDPTGQPVPIGLTGEIYIGGLCVGAGYWQDVALTAEKFVANPFGPGRLYKSGDLARYLPDGNLEYLGRIDHQVKLRGFRIELGEIEALLRQHPAVQECIVIAQHTGQEQRLVAYVTAAHAAATDLRNYLRAHLPDYMVPSAFVTLPALPLTPSGKVDRKALPLPDWSALVAEQIYVAPRTPTETALTHIWGEILGIDRIGMDDNFFALGGHSLLATQIISRIRRTMAVDIGVRAFFETPTVADMARAIDELLRSEEDATYATIPPLVRSQPLLLSYGQERLWFLDQLEGGQNTYNIPFALRLQGKLEVAALARALGEVVRRHEVLRTTFHLQGPQPTQQIHPPSFALPVVDLSLLAVDEREAEVSRCHQAEIHHRFDLAHGPLFRATLFCFAAESEYVLLLNMHHIIADDWSLQLLQREVNLLYQAFVRGEPSPLPELSIQYADFAAWQRNRFDQAALAGQLLYWQEQLRGAPTLLPLPTDRPRPPLQTFNGATYAFSIPVPLATALRRLSHQENATLFMTLLAAFKLLLMRYCGQRDIVVGSPIANRTHLDIEPLIGFFVNTLALRTTVAEQAQDDCSFQTLLAQVKYNTLEAYRHQDLPFEKVVELLRPDRSLSHAPLFQVMFNLLQRTSEPTHQASATTLLLADLRVTPLVADYPIAKFDLTLTMTEETGIRDGQALVAALEYNTDLFDAATIARLAEHYTTLLAGIVANPAAPIQRLPLLTAAEQVLLTGWNATAVAYPSECIHKLFAAQVQRTPGAVALRSGEEQLCYAKLDAQANQLAHYLQELGVGPNVLVGLCVERSLDMVVGLLGILKAGGAYVPLDPTYPAARLAFMLTDAAPPVLLTQAHLVATLPPVAGQLFCLDRDWPHIATQPATPPLSAVTPDHLAYVIYTSGSTGQPKGALNTHAGLSNLLHDLQATHGLTGNDKTLQTTAFSFDVATAEILFPLLNGASLVLTQPDGQRDIGYLVHMIRQHRITTLHVVPTLLQLLLEEADFGRCDSLVRIIVAGEALPLGLQERFLALSIAELHNLYGPTEAAVYVTAWHCRSNYPRPIVPIGRPLANTQTYVLDHFLQPVPVGVAGELYIGGVQVGLGYLQRPALTAERFIANPFGAGRLYKSGDLVRYLPDGNLEYLGRLDQQVKLRGFRIELGEIEAALTQHPAVQAGVVIVRTGASGEPQLVAYVVLRAAADGLRAYLRERLPEYMVPSQIVALAELPLTPNGKLDRQGLPAPAVGERQPEAAPDVARTPTEAALAAIWQGVLQVPDVGLDENFFSLGGDSILSIQVVARARQEGLHLTPRQLFEYQTIRQLAAVTTSGLNMQTPQGAVTGALVLTPIQRWFLGQAWAEPHHYNQAVLLETVPGVNPLQLQGALTALVRHHDALRLRFASTGGAWTATHGPADEAAALQVLDLGGLGTDQRTARLAAAADAAQASLDLGEGPLLRALYCAYGAEPGRLLLVIHHLVVDGVSWRILLEDLALAYAQLAAGTVVVLPAKSSAFQAWGQWLATQGVARLAAERGWWQGVVAQCRHPLPVDAVCPPEANTVAASAAVTSRLDAATTTALLSEAPAAYHTQINDLLLAALAQTVSQWAGQPQVAVALEGHGRELLDDEETGELELARTVGWFTSLFPVVLTVSDPTPAALIPAIKEQLRQIPQRGIGYGVLRYLEDPAGLVPPVPLDLSFNYLGQIHASADAPTTLLLGAAPEASGAPHSPVGLRPHLLEVNALISQGELQVTWRYSRHAHQPATIEALAQGYLTNLRTLITHCCTADAGGYTPSDFTATGLDQAQLARILTKLKV